MKQTEVTVIGAGLTGLSTAYWLTRKGVCVRVVETDCRIGGQIQTQRFQHYVYETGPSTGSVSTPEVAELMNDLAVTSEGRCMIDTAPDTAKRRLIWKGDRFRELPSGLFSAITTPLFRFSDKLRILGEPWRKPGRNPDESIASLTARRLGKSFLDYAVDPFISGVYAGNPDKLVVRFALPKLYALEQRYGSFVRGSIAKKKEPKNDRDHLATKKVFSAQGGLSNIIQAEADFIGMENINLGVSNVRIRPEGDRWIASYTDKESNEQQLESRWVVTTCGAYNLPYPSEDRSFYVDMGAIIEVRSYTDESHTDMDYFTRYSVFDARVNIEVDEDGGPTITSRMTGYPTNSLIDERFAAVKAHLLDSLRPLLRAEASKGLGRCVWDKSARLVLIKTLDGLKQEKETEGAHSILVYLHKYMFFR